MKNKYCVSFISLLKRLIKDELKSVIIIMFSIVVYVLFMIIIEWINIMVIIKLLSFKFHIILVTIDSTLLQVGINKMV
jgi:hypothetical protein